MGRVRADDWQASPTGAAESAEDAGSDRSGSRVDPASPATRRVPPSLLVMPYAVMGVVTVVDLTAGSSVGLLPMISLGPAFAGLVGGWRRTAFIGVLAIALCCAVGVYDGLFAERRGFAAVAAVAGVTVAGLIAAVMRQRREEELASVRSIAEVAQRVLLRPVPRSAGHLRVAVSYTSAVAEARIGGDLYEVVATPYGVRVIIGDVQGKGLEAVETAAVVVGAFREAAYDETDLTGVGERVQRAADRAVDGEKFVTAVIAEIRQDSGATFLNYGHPPPMIVHKDGEVSFPEPPEYALPLGMGSQYKDWPTPFPVALAPDDQLLLYTDGVTEARDHTGTFYPLGLRAHFLKDPDPDAALEALRSDLVQHSEGPLHDDAAMLLIRFRAPDAGAAPQATAPTSRTVTPPAPPPAPPPAQASSPAPARTRS